MKNINYLTYGLIIILFIYMIYPKLSEKLNTESDYIEIDKLSKPVTFSWIGLNENNTSSSYTVTKDCVWRDGTKWKPIVKNKTITEQKVLVEYIKTKQKQLREYTPLRTVEK